MSFLLLAHPNSPGGIKPPTVTSLILVAVFYGVQRMRMRMPPRSRAVPTAPLPVRGGQWGRQHHHPLAACRALGAEWKYPCSTATSLVRNCSCWFSSCVLTIACPSLCKQAWHFRKTGERGGLRAVPSLCPPSAQGQPPSWNAPLHSSLYFLYILHYILKKSKRSTLEERRDEHIKNYIYFYIYDSYLFTTWLGQQNIQGGCTATASAALARSNRVWKGDGDRSTDPR